jgi:O-methyltransferase
VLACDIGAVLTVTDRDARSLYLDQLRRDLTRYGMHERMPVRWPRRRRLLLKTSNTLVRMRMGISPFGRRERDLGLDWFGGSRGDDWDAEAHQPAALL